ncbi:unnamed protein product [Aphis gossypii]|uniref:Uncharacterized protein n=1 Tax=Aphis gossypii TaxID=80765 RepID=A0A9P0NJQ6_APHGO|nr:unnamed protein product [Aphis gossypii]
MFVRSERVMDRCRHSSYSNRQASAPRRYLQYNITSSSWPESGAAALHSSLPGRCGAERAIAKDLECSRRQPSRRNRTLWYARCPARARAHPFKTGSGGVNGGAQSLTPAASPARRSVYVSPSCRFLPSPLEI